MELLIVRHGRPEEHIVESGSANPALTEVGHQQAQAIAEYLMGQSVDHIVSSPMLRARQTAEPLCEAMGYTPEIIDDFKESDYQSAEYKPVEANREEFLAKLEDDPDFLFGLDGRTVFIERVVSAFKAVAAANRGKTVAVFCHGMVTAAFVGFVLGVDDLFKLPVDYTGLSRVQVAPARDIYSVRSFNETMHLRDLPNLRW